MVDPPNFRRQLLELPLIDAGTKSNEVGLQTISVKPIPHLRRSCQAALRIGGTTVGHEDQDGNVTTGFPHDTHGIMQRWSKASAATAELGLGPLREGHSTVVDAGLAVEDDDGHKVIA